MAVEKLAAQMGVPVEEMRHRLAVGARRLAALQAARAADVERSQYRLSTKTYAISDGAGMVKIGVACDVQARLATLQTASPRDLALAGVLDGNHEREMHQRFAGLHVRGEWFKESPELLAAFSPSN